MNVGIVYSEVNFNMWVMNSCGIWFFYVLVIGFFYVVLLSIFFVSVFVVWIFINFIYNMGMYIFLYMVKGIFFEILD